MTGLPDNIATREAMIETCLWMNAEGLNQGTSGNISVRVPDGILITPSGTPYRNMVPEAIVKIGLEGAPEAGGPRVPSSEWPFHQRLHQTRPDMPVVLHAHPPFCSALAVQRRMIPACHYMVAAFGGNDVPLVDYALFGCDRLAQGVAEALTARTGCLMANHGATVLGETIDRAAWRLQELETLAQTYLFSHIGGVPKILTEAEMDEVHAAFQDYGQRRQ